MSWATYLKEHTQGEVGRVTAEKLGVTESNISRWRRGGQVPDARHVVQFARVYGRPVLEALVAAEFITEAEAKVRPSAAPSLGSLSDDELVGEILRRMRRGGGGDAGSAAPMKADYATSDVTVDTDRPDLAVAARNIGKKSAGQKHRAHLSEVGEDNQDPGDTDPA